MGLTPYAEKVSMKDDPVLEINLSFPSAIARTDDRIDELQKQISELTASRNEMLDKAIELGIFEDDNYRLECSQRKTRSVNVDGFKLSFPEEYKQIELIQVNQAIGKAKSAIPIVMAERFVSKSALESVLDVNLGKEKWEVIKKD